MTFLVIKNLLLDDQSVAHSWGCIQNALKNTIYKNWHLSSVFYSKQQKNITFCSSNTLVIASRIAFVSSPTSIRNTQKLSPSKADFWAVSVASVKAVCKLASDAAFWDFRTRSYFPTILRWWFFIYIFHKNERTRSISQYLQ